MPLFPFLIGYVVVAGGVVMAYPQFRQGALSLRKDARSIVRKTRRKIDRLSSPNDGSSTPTSSMLALGAEGGQTVYGVYEGERIRTKLWPVAKQIPMRKDSRTKHDFARHVLEFVRIKMMEYPGEQRFFIWHPDATWHDEFMHLAYEEALLPDDHRRKLAGIGQDLFVLLRYMLCTRASLEEQLGDEHARQITFHILIPTWGTMVIPRPLRLANGLFPIAIDGEVMGGEKCVWMNLESGRGLEEGILRGVGNLRDLPKAWKDGVRFPEGADMDTCTATDTLFSSLGVVACRDDDFEHVAVTGLAVDGIGKGQQP